MGKLIKVFLDTIGKTSKNRGEPPQCHINRMACHTKKVTVLLVASYEV